MSKIPKNPEQVFVQFTNDYKNSFGEDLISVILYGSAARGEYVYKKSDINFIIVLSENGIGQLRKALPLIKKWQKRKVTTPLIITHHYIQTSLDSFPIEFLNIKQHYKVIFGEDVLAGIQVNVKDLRLQCEREIRGKLLHLREGFLNTYGKPRLMKQLLQYSLPAFISIFSALLHLKEKPIPSSKREIFKATAEEFGLDAAVFEKIIQVNQGSLKVKKEELSLLVEQYIEQIRKLTNIVDKL